MENKIYPNYTLEIQNLKTKRSVTQKNIDREAIEQANVTDFYEGRELIAIAEAFNNSDKDTINPLASYNTNLKIKELGETAIAKNPSTEDQLKPLMKKVEEAVNEASDKANAEQANSELFSYYGWISDLQVASDTMIDIAKKLNADPNLEAAMSSEVETTEQSQSVLGRIKNHFDDLKKNLEKVINETGKTIGQAGQALSSKLGEAADWLKKNVVSKFVQAFKWVSEKFDAFRLKLFESMFDFIRRVVDLAAVKEWKIEKISVGMPEISLSMTDIAGIKIPIPMIKGPPVSFIFKPK